LVFIHPTASVVHEFELPDVACAEFAHHQVEPQTDALLQGELAIQSRDSEANWETSLQFSMIIS